MGYRITYGGVKKPRGGEHRICRKAALTGLAFLAFWILVQVCWPRGAGILRTLLLPEETAVMAVALEELTWNLKDGTDFISAVSLLIERMREGSCIG